MTYAETVKFLVAMIIMINPLASLTIFLQLTESHPLTDQRKTALSCGFAMCVIMIITVWLGSGLLELLGITIDSFRVAGGIILFLSGFAMLQSRESPLNHTPADDVAAEKRASIAVVPLALPIIIGPGAISTLVIASNDYPTAIYKSWLSILCLGLGLGMMVIMYHGATLAKLIGESVIKLITRIMGMLIMAIAASMLAHGIVGLIPALKGI